MPTNESSPVIRLLTAERARVEIYRSRLEALVELLRHPRVAGVLEELATAPVMLGKGGLLQELLGDLHIVAKVEGPEASLSVSEMCFQLAASPDIGLSRGDLLFEGGVALYRELQSGLDRKESISEEIDAVAQRRATKLNAMPMVGRRHEVRAWASGARFDPEFCEWASLDVTSGVSPERGGGLPRIRPRSFTIFEIIGTSGEKKVYRRALVEPWAASR